MEFFFRYKASCLNLPFIIKISRSTLTPRYRTIVSCDVLKVEIKKNIIFVSMSRNYKFHNPEGTYFISFAVVECLESFTRNEYKDIIIDNLHYCQKEKVILKDVIVAK